MSLDCPFLIAPSVFSNVFITVSLDCPFLIAPSVFSNVFITMSLDCPFLIALRFSLTFLLQCLWIVHSWSLLRFSLVFILIYNHTPLGRNRKVQRFFFYLVKYSSYTWYIILKTTTNESYCIFVFELSMETKYASLR